MKRLISVLLLALLILSFTACEGTSISTEKYNEISNHVLKNISSLSSEKDIEFFEYETTGAFLSGVDYGYYYTVSNEITLPDYYYGDSLREAYKADGGAYFGKPNNGTDWCFIKMITDHWFYYELHSA